MYVNVTPITRFLASGRDALAGRIVFRSFRLGRAPEGDSAVAHRGAIVSCISRAFALAVITLALIGLGLSASAVLASSGASGAVVSADAGPETDHTGVADIEDADRDDPTAELLSSGVASAQSDSPIQTTPPDDERVVVRFDDDHISTAAVAEELPPEPAITVEDDGPEIVIDDHDDYDLPVMQTTDGEVAKANGDTIHPVNDNPDLVTFDNETETVGDELEVDRSSGEVQTIEGDEVRVDDDRVVYPEYNTRDYSLEITEVEDVDEGETLSVTATVNNSRWAHSDDDTASLNLSGGERDFLADEESIDLEDDDETELSFEYETGAGDHDIDEAEVTIEHQNGGDTVNGDSDTADLTIGAAGVAVTITETNTPVEGSDLVVDADITRYGDVPEGTQSYPISLFVDGSQAQTEVLSLSPGESTTQTFTYETTEDDVPELEAEVASRVDSSSETVSVMTVEEHKDNIGAEITETTIGNISEPLTVDTAFTYDDELPSGQTEFDANLTIDETVVDQQTFEFGGVPSTDDPVTETFTYDRDAEDPPVTDFAIETPGGNESVSLDHDTAISFSNVTDPAARNETLEATVTLENTGEVPGQETLNISALNPSAVDSNATIETTAELNPGESVSEDVTFDLSDNAPPQLELEVQTSTTTETTTAEVRDNEPEFEITDTAVTEADSDENATLLTVASTVENTGGVAGTQDVSLSFDDETVHTESVSLEPDEEATITTEVEVTEDQTYGYGTTTEDDSVSETTDVASSATADTGGILSLLPVGSILTLLLALSVLGALVVGAAVIKRRTDPTDLPDGLQDRMAALQPAAQRLQNAARNLVSNDGTGTVVVQNNLPRDALVRIRVRSGDEIQFLEDFELAAEERRTLECLPTDTQFEVGSGVDDIAAHEERFDGGTSEVGVILRPEGITIKPL
ncbi:hypothetical protein G6M89_14300 [Natronolimnobius sp. AArcel1]|uniref:hypothetical protein n=1 Tax=Natronolimnobius sp. AArcel1 TaxID=1679093 RepID=UPI0013EE0609|nr:hypothetical protein [Natronolimnobius sp. AArcel1]NGM70165.1 hypothetical protein [Natronolimnobius sp. AArcel1]